MKITSQLRPAQMKAGGQQPTPPNQEPPEEDGPDVMDKVIYGLELGGAASGGALAGMFLGGVAGKMLSNATGIHAFQNYGGIVGGVGGAVGGYGAVSDSELLKRSMYAQALGTAGMIPGMYVGEFVGNWLTEAGASAQYAANGTLVGALALASVGVSKAYGSHTGFGEKVKDVRGTLMGASLGLGLGGVAQALSSGSAMAGVMTVAPAVYGVTGALLGANGSMQNNYFDRTDENGEKTAYQKLTEGVQVASSFGLGGSLGFTVGSAAGAGLQSLAGALPGLASHYHTSMPALGAATGAMIAAANETQNEDWARAARITGVGGVGAVLGNLSGYGLSQMTGLPIYGQLGEIAGALTGASGAAMLDGTDTKLGKLGNYAFPITFGTVGGSAAGAAVGALLGWALESASYQTVGSGLGTLAGGLTGLAFALQRAQRDG